MATATRISPEPMDVERGGPRIFDPVRAVPGTAVPMPAPTPKKSPADRLFQNISELAFPLGKGRKRKTRKGGKRKKSAKRTRKH